jgi:hypothetical protein
LASRNEAPAHDQPSGLVQFTDICSASILDAETSAGIAADYLEIVEGIELRSLLRRKPLPEKTPATLLRAS